MTKIIFAGTPEFSAVCLSEIVKSGHEVLCCLTKPDKAAGRGMKVQPSAVKVLSTHFGIQILQPHSLQLIDWNKKEVDKVLKIIENLNFKAMVISAYGLIIPKEMLDIIYNKGCECINIHASLLPRWRGAAPIQRAIEFGDQKTGITLMRVENGLDTGSILYQASLPIYNHETAGDLYYRLAKLGSKLIVKMLNKIDRHENIDSYAQSDIEATYAKKIKKSESFLNWNKNAIYLDRKIRAFNPIPGTVFCTNSFNIKIWKASPIIQNTKNNSSPGTILEISKDGVIVQTGHQCLLLKELQQSCKRRIHATVLAKQLNWKIGEKLIYEI